MFPDICLIFISKMSHVSFHLELLMFSLRRQIFILTMYLLDDMARLDFSQTTTTQIVQGHPWEERPWLTQSMIKHIYSTFFIWLHYCIQWLYLSTLFSLQIGGGKVIFSIRSLYVIHVNNSCLLSWTTILIDISLM